MEKKFDKEEIGNALVVALAKAVKDAFPDQDIRVEFNGEEIIVDIDEEDEEEC